MKGLILKDIMCLKKQLMVFGYCIVGVMAVAAMYVLSCRFGNLAAVGEKIIEGAQASPLEVDYMATIPPIFFLLIPLVAVGDMTNVFAADGKASFARVAGSLPLSAPKRLLARYLTIFALAGIGILADILVAGVMSALADILTFGALLGIIFSGASVVAMYSAFAILYCILLGHGKESVAQVLSLLTLVALYLLLRWEKWKEIALSIAASDRGETEGEMSIERLWDFLETLEHRAYIPVLCALFVTCASYGLAVLILRRKRGVI